MSLPFQLWAELRNIVGRIEVLAEYRAKTQLSGANKAALMQTVGTVVGVVGGISLVMIIMGLIGKKV